MALTANVTKTAVSLRMPKMWAITLTLVLQETGVDVLTQSFTENYKLGHSISALAGRFLVKMQAAIDRYKSEQVVLDHADLDAVVVGLNGNLETE